MPAPGPSLEELDHQPTPLGPVTLQRRRYAALGDTPVYEVKLGDEYLMSSLFYVAERALAELGLEPLEGQGALDVVVGGLGLGYTAVAALENPSVSRCVVVEYLEPVLDWHRRGLVPNGPVLTGDSRTVLHHADFFAASRGEHGFDPETPGHRFDAILLDIDHTPEALLNPSHQDLYGVEGLTRLARFLRPGGTFALWSNDAPVDAFTETLAEVFGEAQGHTIVFENPFRPETGDFNGIYVAVNRS